MSIERVLTGCTRVAALLLLTLAGPLGHAADAAPIVEYTLIHHMLEDADPTPLLRVYDDGRVDVHYPVYMTRAGDYSLRLSGAELSGMLTSLGQTGLLQLDLDRAYELRLEAERSALSHVSDVTETVIRIRLDAGHPRPATFPTGAIDTTIRWPNVYTDRKRFPNMSAVATIDAAEQTLRALLDRTDLAEVQP